MRVLIVANYNKDQFTPFITEQVDSLKSLGVDVDYFGVVGKGNLGYLKNRKKLIRKIKGFQPDIIHAHYGLSGLLANLQRKIPVVTTYHGTDINNDKVFRYSKISIFLSSFNIFVSEKNRTKAKQTKKQALIPCGVDIDLFKPIEKQDAREKLGYKQEDKLVLFAGAFDNKLKNAELAKEAITQLGDVKLIELKGYTRQEVALLMNAVNTVLMTSFTEGSPQFIKEAMACNCPIVSVDVGDVKEIASDVKSCFISDYDVSEIAGNLQKAISLDKTTSRDRIIKLGLDSKTIAKKIIGIYKQVVAEK